MSIDDETWTKVEDNRTLIGNILQNQHELLRRTKEIAIRLNENCTQLEELDMAVTGITRVVNGMQLRLDIIDERERNHRIRSRKPFGFVAAHSDGSFR
jgi:hypothetical protein